MLLVVAIILKCIIELQIIVYLQLVKSISFIYCALSSKTELDWIFYNNLL